MCGRMTLTAGAGEIAAFFALESAAALLEPDGRALRPHYNLSPSQRVLTIAHDAEGQRRAQFRTWGLVPAWAKEPSIGARLFNARSETVETKPSFRAAFRKRRCLVVADGFYEWTARNRGHRAHWLHPPGGGLLAFAGLYEHWSAPGGPEIESCTVLTTDANADVAAIHARMPVLLARERFDEWLARDTALQHLKALLVPAPEGSLDARPVSRRVHDARHDDPDCLAPAEREVDLFPAVRGEPLR